MKLSLKMRARALGPHMNSMKPSMVHDAHVSPECTRADMQIALRA
eukprot:CAMPEP_0206217524 /NCGR_PEP_ID=MMETSP0047_2-20121206/3320_1 /ASSEMBLY_ACC=CAM_ASM_000192 /TAXON_ID=195065 /ORGANISM="Chroomonas mesostigmatica_cf, Strain CCMP1168" /LENGTH=44 /DNA_ID= /DNA_START= /DNA_END= /DNA_ORIENTATION=